MLNKVSKTIGWLRKLQNVLQRPSLITIYKLFIRPYLYYVDIIYNQACKRVFHQTLESNAALAMTGDIEGHLENSFIMH